MIVVLMGVSGSGKTTIGTLLAAREGCVFADADDYHSEANKTKMAGGHALDDHDRQPWLQSLNQLMRGWYESGSGGVLACSALKATYRQTLAAGMPSGVVQFVLLDGAKAMIAERLMSRKGHYMSSALLDSQLATLETPDDALCVINDRAPGIVVDEILHELSSKA